MPDVYIALGILQVIVALAMIVAIFASRVIHHAGASPWELVALSAPDIFGLIITLVAAHYTGATIVVAEVRVDLLSTLCAILLANFVFAFAVGFTVIMQSALTHNRTLRSLNAPPVYSAAVKKNLQSRQSAIKPPIDVIVDTNTAQTQQQVPAAVTTSSMNLIPIGTIFTKALIISTLSTLTWGASRIRFLQQHLGPTDPATSDWVSRGALVCSLTRAVLFAMCVIIPGNPELVPGVCLVVIVCLVVALIGVALESHGSPGSDFCESVLGGRTLRVDALGRDGGGSGVYGTPGDAAENVEVVTMSDRLEVEILRRIDQSWEDGNATYELVRVATALGFGVGGSLKSLRGGGGEVVDADGGSLDRKKFIGRREELRSVLEAARVCCSMGVEPTGRTFLISGELGIGKTTFIEAVKSDLAELNPKFGTYTVWNRPHLATMSSLGYALRSLLDSIGLRPSKLPTVARNMPEQFRSLLPLLGLVVPELATPETDASRVRMCSKALFNALAGVITCVIQSWKTSNGLTVLIFENAQWCDDFSLEVINRLPQSASKIKLPLLLLLTARTDGILYHSPSTAQQTPSPQQKQQEQQQLRISVMGSGGSGSFTTLAGILSNPVTTHIQLRLMQHAEIAEIVDTHIEIAPHLTDSTAQRLIKNCKGLPVEIVRWSTLIRNQISHMRRQMHTPAGLASIATSSGPPGGVNTVAAVATALENDADVADHAFHSFEQELQDLMAITSALGPEMDLEGMYYLFQRLTEGDTSATRFTSIVKSLIDKRVLVRGSRVPLSANRHSINRHPTTMSVPQKSSLGGSVSASQQLEIGGLHRITSAPKANDPIANGSEDNVLVWRQDWLMESAYRSLIATRRVEVHKTVARFLVTRLSRSDNRLVDVEAHLEIAYHLDKAAERWMAVFYHVLAVEQGCLGYPFLIRLDVLLYADSFSMRQKPSGPVDLPSKPLASDSNRDLLHGTIEYLFAISGSTTDDITSSRLIWSHGSEMIGRFVDIPKQLPGLVWRTQSMVLMASMKQRVRSSNGVRSPLGFAGLVLVWLTPLIGLNLDNCSDRAMNHFITSVNLLEEHGSSVSEVLVGYAWLQHHLAYAKHFGLREKVIKKGRTFIASMGPEELSQGRMGVAFFEGMIGLGFAVAGSFEQAEAFLLSATELADVLIISYPLSSLFIFQIITFIEAGKILEATKLIFLARQRMQNDDASDRATMQLLDALHVYMSITMGHGYQTTGITPELLTMAEDLIDKTLESICERPTAFEAARMATSALSRPATSALNNRPSTRDGLPANSVLPTYISSESVASMSSSAYLDSTFEISNWKTTVNNPVIARRRHEKVLNPSTPQATLMISILALIAFHIENHDAAALFLDYLLHPATFLKAKQQVSQGCGLITAHVCHHQKNVIAPVNSAAYQTSPLACSWVPTAPFFIARAAEAALRIVLTHPKPSHFNATLQQLQIQLTHNSIPPPPELHLKREAWRNRVRLTLSYLHLAATKVPHMQAEDIIMSLVFRTWDSSSGGASCTSAPKDGTSPALRNTAKPRLNTSTEMVRELCRARDSARANQRVWIEALAHAQAATMLGGSTAGQAKFSASNFEDWRLFEEECGAKVMVFNSGSAAGVVNAYARDGQAGDRKIAPE